MNGFAQDVGSLDLGIRRGQAHQQVVAVLEPDGDVQHDPTDHDPGAIGLDTHDVKRFGLAADGFSRDVLTWRIHTLLESGIARGVLHKNTASRKFSRLTKRVSAL